MGNGYVRRLFFSEVGKPTGDKITGAPGFAERAVYWARLKAAFSARRESARRSRRADSVVISARGPVDRFVCRMKAMHGGPCVSRYAGAGPDPV
jgi:hypothetical protein